MKIKEALDIINGTTTVKAKYDNHSIFVCFKFLPFDGHCFLALRANVNTWDGVTLVSGAIDEVIPQDLARVMDVVQRLLDTPVKDRFPEKKHRLVWQLPQDCPEPWVLGYAKTFGNWDINDEDWLNGKGYQTRFTDADLKKIADGDRDMLDRLNALKKEVKNNAC